MMILEEEGESYTLSIPNEFIIDEAYAPNFSREIGAELFLCVVACDIGRAKLAAAECKEQVSGKSLRDLCK